MHFIHAVTQPAPIRYKDLLGDIEECSRRVDQWAVVASQAELREIHSAQSDILTTARAHYDLTQSNTVQLDEILRLLRPIPPQLTGISDRQALHSSVLFDTNYRVDSLQIVQMLEHAAGSSTTDPEAVYRSSLFLCKRYHARSRKPETFWLSEKLRDWDGADHSCFVFVKGSFVSRFKAKSFSVSLIQTLREAPVHVLWVLPEPNPKSLAEIRPVDLVKSLVLQAMRINKNFQTTKACNQISCQLNNQSTELEWMEVLFAILSGLSTVYIVFDVESLAQRPTRTDTGLSWPGLFSSFFKTLASQGIRTVVKVLFVSYGCAGCMPDSFVSQNITVRIDAPSRLAARQALSRQSQFSSPRRGAGIGNVRFTHLGRGR